MEQTLASDTTRLVPNPGMASAVMTRIAGAPARQEGADHTDVRSEARAGGDQNQVHFRWNSVESKDAVILLPARCDPHASAKIAGEGTEWTR